MSRLKGWLESGCTDLEAIGFYDVNGRAMRDAMQTFGESIVEQFGSQMLVMCRGWAMTILKLSEPHWVQGVVDSFDQEFDPEVLGGIRGRLSDYVQFTYPAGCRALVVECLINGTSYRECCLKVVALIVAALQDGRYAEAIEALQAAALRERKRAADKRKADEELSRLRNQVDRDDDDDDDDDDEMLFDADDEDDDGRDAFGGMDTSNEGDASFSPTSDPPEDGETSKLPDPRMHAGAERQPKVTRRRPTPPPPPPKKTTTAKKAPKKPARKRR